MTQNALQDAIQRLKSFAGNAANQVGSFVQKYPSPASYVQQEIAPPVQKLLQSFQTPLPQQYAQANFRSLPQYVSPAITKLNAFVQDSGRQLFQRAATTPVLPFIPQSTLPNLGKASQFIGTQLQRVNLPEFNIPQPLKAGIPALQLPEQINTYAQSYGRTLANPLKNPLETAMNVLPFVGFTKTKGIQQALRDRVALSKTPEEAAIMYNEFADKLIKTGAKDDLQALRATFNKELTNLVGGSGSYKTDYAIIQTMKNDTTIGPIIRTLENKIATIDEVLSKVPEKWVNQAPVKLGVATRLSPSRGLGQELARTGLTWDEIIKLRPDEGQKILSGRAALEDFTMSQTPVKQKVNLLDYLRTPNRVLEKIGMGDEAKLLRQQWGAYQMTLPKEIDRITAWSKRVGPESNERIFRALDGENVGLIGEESKVYSEIRSYLNDWATKLNLPPHKRVSDYITRLYKIGTIEAEFDEDLAKIIDPTIAKSIYNPFMQRRVGQRVDYLRDTWRALQAYVKRGTRKYYMDPVLERVAQKAETLPLESWDYVKAKVSGINMRPEAIDTLIDNFIKSSPVGYRLGQRPTALVTRNARQMVFRGLLGLNPASALRNLQQSTNTYAVLGERDFGIGMGKTILNLPKFLMNKDTELETLGVLGKDIIQDRSLNAIKKFWEVADKEGFYRLFDLAEKLNRGIAFWGAKAQGIRRGMNEQQAIEFGKSIVGKTQFFYDVIDTPVALQSDLMKTVFQFARYPIAQSEFLIEMVKDKNIIGSIRWVAANVLFYATVGKLIGDTWKSMIPTYRFGTPPTVQLPVETGKAVLNVPNKYGKVSDEQNVLKRVIESQGVQRGFMNYVPAGNQVRKTYEGLQSYNQGASMTPTGRTRFQIEQTPENLLRSALFGQYSTPEAQQYFAERSAPSTGASPTVKKLAMGSGRVSTGRRLTFRSVKVPKVKLARARNVRGLKLRLPKLTYPKPLTTRRLKVRGLASVPKMRRLKLRSIASLQKKFLTLGRKNALQIAKSNAFRLGS